MYAPQGARQRVPFFCMSRLSHPGTRMRPGLPCAGIAVAVRMVPVRVIAVRVMAVRSVGSAHADAQIAIAIHAQLHIRKLTRTGRVLNAHALAVLAGERGRPAVAIASLAVKERHVQAALPAAGLREQGHLATRHTSSSSRPIHSASSYYESRRICVRNLMKREKCGIILSDTYSGGKL